MKKPLLMISTTAIFAFAVSGCNETLVQLVQFNRTLQNTMVKKSLMLNFWHKVAVVIIQHGRKNRMKSRGKEAVMLVIQ